MRLNVGFAITQKVCNLVTCAETQAFCRSLADPELKHAVSTLIDIPPLACFTQAGLETISRTMENYFATCEELWKDHYNRVCLANEIAETLQEE